MCCLNGSFLSRHLVFLHTLLWLCCIKTFKMWWVPQTHKLTGWVTKKTSQGNMVKPVFSSLNCGALCDIQALVSEIHFIKSSQIKSNRFHWDSLTSSNMWLTLSTQLSVHQFLASTWFFVSLILFCLLDYWSIWTPLGYLWILLWMSLWTPPSVLGCLPVF